MNPITVSHWRPPEGYITVESKLDGVTVFAPAPAAAPSDDQRTFKCPRCGATTAFDPGAGSVVCGNCGFGAPVQAAVAGQAAPSDEFKVETLEREARGWGQARRELHCDACGANLSLAPNDLNATCAFCGSNKVAAHTASDEALRPRYLIPFKVEIERCHSLARDWLGRGWMHPSGLATAAGSARFTGVYLPYWTFSARVAANWRAQVGYERQERVYDHGTKKWRTETKIDWRWESGQAGVTITDQMEAGTTKVSPVLLRRLNSFDLSALTAYDPGFLAGWQAHPYDVPLSQAWDTARMTMREQAKQACRGEIASPHVRDLNVSADFENETWRYILAPVYLAPYRFGGQPFQLMVNGQTGEVVGQKPVQWLKVWLAVAALLAPGVLLALIGLPLTLVAGLGVVVMGVGGALFLGGLMLSGWVVWQAMQAGQA
jgi:hypothetical protein